MDFGQVLVDSRICTTRTERSNALRREVVGRSRKYFDRKEANSGACALMFRLNGRECQLPRVGDVVPPLHGLLFCVTE